MDYSKLSDDAINQVIAERLGYELYSWGGRKEYLMLVAPHEREYGPDDYEFLIGAGGDYARRLTVDEAWDDVPKWATDLNEAIELPAKGMYIYLMKSETECIGRLADPTEGETVTREVAAPNQPARAICLAWLAYMDVIKAHGQRLHTGE